MSFALIIATVFMVAVPRLAAQAPQGPVPMVFIEAFRSTDTVGRSIAASLREALAKSVSPTRLVVMSTADIEIERGSGMPDDWGKAWKWFDVRELSHDYRAACTIDLLATSSRSRIMVAVARLCAPFHGDPDRLKPVTTPTAEAAVAILVRRLASDSVLFVVRPPPPPPPLPPPVDSAQLGRFRVRVKDSESGRFVSMEYVLFTPPNISLYANMYTDTTADGWGPIRYGNPGNHVIELNKLRCGNEDWSLENGLRKSFVITRGRLTSVEFVVSRSTLRMAKAYDNPEGHTCSNHSP